MINTIFEYNLTSFILQVLIALAACTSAQLVDPFLGFVPWVQPGASAVLKSAESAEPADAEVAKTPGTFQYTYPNLYSYPFFPTAHVVSTDEKKPVVSNVLTYSASNLLPFYHTPLLKTAEVKEADEKSPLSFLSKPLLYYGSPYVYGNHLPLAYSTLPLTVKAATAEEPAEETAAVPARKKRDIQVPLPFLRAVADETKVEYKTSALDATDDATPADTTKLDLVTKTHELSIPTVKYVQDVVSVKPVTYSAPLVTSNLYGYPFAHAGLHPLTYSGFGYHPLTYSGLNPFGYSFYGHPFTTLTAAKPAEPAAEPAPEVVAE